MATAATLIAFMQISQGFVDTLKLGNGIRSGTFKGFVVDGLRLLNITGVGGAVFQRLSRVLVVTQTGGNLCSWIATANAIRRSGQRFFISLADLAAEAGVDLRVINITGTSVAQLLGLQRSIGRLGIPYVTLRTGTALGEIRSVLTSYPKSVLVFAVKFTTGTGREAGHQMIATFSRSAGLVIKNTDGTVYRTLEALLKAFPMAELYSDASFIIPNAAIMNVAGTAQTAGTIANIILEVFPLWTEFDIFNASDWVRNRHKPWEY